MPKNRYSITALVAYLDQITDIDLTIELAESRDEMLRKLDTKTRVVVAYSFTSFEAEFVAQEIAYLRRNLNKRFVIFIAGGAHPSGAPQETIDMGFDYVFRGSGEDALKAFLKQMSNNNLPKNRIITASKCQKNLDKYPPFSKKHNLYMPIEIMRGCIFGCRYCQVTYTFGAPIYRSIDNTVESVEFMFKKGFRDFRFIAPNSLGYMSVDSRTANLEAIEKLLSGIRETIGPKGRIFFGTFPSEMRPEFISPEAVELLKAYTHNQRIVLGAQALTDFLLKEMHREHTVDDVFKAVELLIKAGYEVAVDIITGIEREKDIEATIKGVERLLKKRVRIHLHTLIPLPGTPWARRAVSIPKKLQTFWASLEGRGLVFGNWKEQYQFVRGNFS